MKNNLIYSVFIIAMLLLSSCSNKEKIKNSPVPSTPKKSLINAQQTMTLGQKHNLLVEEYLAQYGAVIDNSITIADVETICGRFALIAEQQGLLENFIATELSEKMMQVFDASHAFENGILKASNELKEATINETPNEELQEAFFYIHDLSLQNDPNFISKSMQRLNELNSLTQEEQQGVNGYKSILESSFNLWANPNSIYTNGGNDPRVRPTTETDALSFWQLQLKAIIFTGNPIPMSEYELNEIGFGYSAVNSLVETMHP
ncbi:hypothetical protein F0919_09610 [Taibaiella lutea]|uniref:Uncharacterized protein n=1 Tax=Taibaiella lutea TaxID=2608001 RepID=A0A5M6CNX1_9BACT|nr:hypothetical protein [Taibaiella lutea]KAA5534849.1 hypothetical protein F0919_09610 [Taibaiella lutea]